MKLIQTLKILMMSALLTLGFTFSFPASAVVSPYFWVSISAITLEQAASQVKKETGGRILSAKEVKQQGASYFQIKVMISPGHIQVIKIDPVTGSRMNKEGRK